MNKNQRIVVSIVGITIVVVAILGLTYGYFVTKVKKLIDSSKVDITSGKLELVYGDGNGLINAGNNLNPGTVIKEKTFTVKNTGTSTIVNYAIALEEVINELKRKGDLVYTLTCKSDKGECNGVTGEKEFPSIDELILISGEIKSDETHTYTLTVKYIERNEDQSVDMGATFSGKVNIKSIDTNLFKEKTLAYQILKNAIEHKNEKSTIYSPEPKTIPAQQISGENERTLSITEDDYGISYYYRGNVEDNYLTFANMCWRIVRIEGDGSIKLTLEDKLTTCASAKGGVNAFIGQGSYGYSSLPDYERCSNDKSTCMRTILQKWFNEKFTNNDKTIYPSNDKPILKEEFKNIIKYEKWRLEDTTTTISGVYPIRERLWNNRKPYATLLYLENDTSFNDYVSSLSADEVVFAGMVAKNTTNINSYVFKLQNSIQSNTTWVRLLSHFSKGTSAGLCDNGTLNCGIKGGSGISSTTGYIWPSIALKNNISFKSGNGTKTDPYVIS